MLDELREVPPNKMTNRGKSFNSNEIINILKDFKILINSGQTKKSAINSLSEKYGRGYWSILKIIDGTTNKSSGNKNIDTN